MEKPNISQDDLTDIVELSNKIEDFIDQLMEDNDQNVGMSALFSAFFNCSFRNCSNLMEMMVLRSIIIQTIDSMIKNVKVKNKP